MPEHNIIIIICEPGVGFGLVEMAISSNPKPTIYRNLYKNTGAVCKLHPCNGVWNQLAYYLYML